jgi:hypothetical protein
MDALEQLILESAVRPWLRPQKTNDWDFTALRIGRDGGARLRSGAVQNDRVPLPSNEKAFSHYGTGVVRDLSLIIVAVDHDSSLTTQGEAGTIATVPTY